MEAERRDLSGPRPPSLNCSDAGPGVRPKAMLVLQTQALPEGALLSGSPAACHRLLISSLPFPTLGLLALGSGYFLLQELFSPERAVFCKHVVHVLSSPQLIAALCVFGLGDHLGRQQGAEGQVPAQTGIGGAHCCLLSDGAKQVCPRQEVPYGSRLVHLPGTLG